MATKMGQTPQFHTTTTHQSTRSTTFSDIIQNPKQALQVYQDSNIHFQPHNFKMPTLPYLAHVKVTNGVCKFENDPVISKFLKNQDAIISESHSLWEKAKTTAAQKDPTNVVTIEEVTDIRDKRSSFRNLTYSLKHEFAWIKATFVSESDVLHNAVVGE